MVVDGSLGVHDVPLEGVLRVLGSQGVEGVDIAIWPMELVERIYVW